MLGALWRYWDGTGKYLRTTYRNIIGLCIGMLLGYTSLGDYGVLVGLMSVLILIPGYTKWEDPLYMMVRYGFPSLLIVVLTYALTTQIVWWYFPVGLMAGASYYMYMKIDSYLPRFHWITGWTTYGEVTAGLLLIDSVLLF